MKATTEYLKYLMEQRAHARNQNFTLQRMHDLGLEFRKEPQDLPAWAEAFGKKMKATTQYLKYLMEQRAYARNQNFTLQRMHDLGLEFRKEPQDLPAWAEAFGEKVHRYWGGGVEAENPLSVG